MGEKLRLRSFVAKYSRIVRKTLSSKLIADFVVLDYVESGPASFCDGFEVAPEALDAWTLRGQVRRPRLLRQCRAASKRNGRAGNLQRARNQIIKPLIG